MPPWTSEPGGFIRGDSNADRTVNISDAVFTLGYLFLGGPTPECLAAADSNDDETIDITDPLKTLSMLFSDGQGLPPPWPEPGTDPTSGIGCAGTDGGGNPTGPQVPLPGGEPIAGSHIRLDVRLSGGGIEVVKARIFDGPLTEGTAVVGELIAGVFTADGRVLGAGSFQDPRVRRGTARPGAPESEEDAEHSITLHREARFSIKLPNGGFTDDEIPGIRVRLYDLTAPHLTDVTPEIFSRLAGTGLTPRGETDVGDVAEELGPALERWRHDIPEPVPPDPTVTTLLRNGPAGEKKNLVVLGEGFAANDQEEYNTIVEDMVMKGAFGSGVYKECLGAFNIFRINAVSRDSGVTKGSHTQYETDWVVDPSLPNLHGGVVVITMPDQSQHSLGLVGANRSLEKLMEGIQNIVIPGQDSCGNPVEHRFNLRMSYVEQDVDGDGDKETKGKLWIGAPWDLVGAAGDFQMVFVPLLGGEDGGDLVINKKVEGELIVRDTVMDRIVSGEWDYAWYQGSCTTQTRTESLLSLVPEWDYVIIILNEPDGAGNGGGGFQVVGKEAEWGVLVHELGHGIAGLADEYIQARPYEGPRPVAVNVDTETDRSQIKWKDFISPFTNLPTKFADVNDFNQACGAFEGAMTYSKEIYRPVFQCRMRADNDFCPVCYRQTRYVLYPWQGFNFHNVYAGDFNGDGKQDLVQHGGTTLALFISDGAKLEPVFFATEHLPGGWRIRSHDRYFVGDHDNDGRDDLFVFNGEDWSEEYLAVLLSTGTGFIRTARYDDVMTGWHFKPHDSFHVGDFDGDGRADLYVFNGLDWGSEYLGMLRSKGPGFEVVRRYDGSLPGGWNMEQNDRIFIGDSTGDGKDDFYIANLEDWGNSKYLAMFRSEGTSVAKIVSYSNDLPSWGLETNDHVLVGDWSGDGKADLYVFNGDDTAPDRLGMFLSTGSGLTHTRTYTDTVSTGLDLTRWDLRTRDELFVADVNGDGRDDLYAFNGWDWSGQQYLGVLRSTGSGLTASRQQDKIGRWDLVFGDRFLPADFNGDGKVDLIARKSSAMSLLESLGASLEEARHYWRYIHNYLYSASLGHGVPFVVMD